MIAFSSSTNGSRTGGSGSDDFGLSFITFRCILQFEEIDLSFA